MNEEPTPGNEEEVPEDDSEAGEAESVAAVGMEAPGLTDAEARELDARTLEDLDQQQRAELEQVAGELQEERGEAEAVPLQQLSKNFRLSEFHCCRGHCAAAHVPADAIPALRRLVVEVLQPLRDRFSTGRVHSAYRNGSHNSHVNGAANSRHRYDRFSQQPGVDISFARGSVSEWAAEARRLLGTHRGGVGTYSWGIHVDLGPPRKW